MQAFKCKTATPIAILAKKKQDTYQDFQETATPSGICIQH